MVHMHVCPARRGADHPAMGNTSQRRATKLAGRALATVVFAALGAGGFAEQGILGVGLGMLAAVAALLTWTGRRRRRAAADQAERHSLARFEAMVEQSSDISMVTDLTGRRSYVSPAVEHLLGIPRDV